jgi:hypothetical protein
MVYHSVGVWRTETNLFGFAEFLHALLVLVHAVLSQVQMDRFLQYRQQ